MILRFIRTFNFGEEFLLDDVNEPWPKVLGMEQDPVFQTHVVKHG